MTGVQTCALPISAEHLYDGETERDSNVLEVHVNHLRRKLGRAVIETRRGQGYRFTGYGVTQ